MALEQSLIASHVAHADNLRQVYLGYDKYTALELEPTLGAVYQGLAKAEAFIGCNESRFDEELRPVFLQLVRDGLIDAIAASDAPDVELTDTDLEDAINALSEP